MHLRRTPPRPGRRRGMILLIVLVMLTLFAIAGLTFVLYATATSESARISRDAESYATSGGPDYDPNAAFALFLGQFIYGTTDPTANDSSGAYSALRGHSLAETMYGSYDANGNIPSDAPYDGTGRLHEPNLFAGADGYQMVNYTYFSTDNILRDPSRIGTRANPSAARTTFTGGQNAPYTYPDLNSMFLASINSSTGAVVMPSYYRGWLFDPSNQGPADPNWTNAVGKYLTLRPRPQEMGPGFPLPTTATGQPDPNNLDVKNLIGMPGGNDSIWIDIGAPELTTAAGLRYKMLVAPLVLDLDNRVNLNVVGNVLANGNLHASNQGWGPWEVNMSKVLNATAAPNEWQNIFLGNPPTGTATITGRYGATPTDNPRLPTATFPGGGSAAHVYGPTDLDGLINMPAPGGSVTGTGTGPYALPGMNAGYFPTWDPNAYLNGTLPEHTNSSGQFNHPMYFNPMFGSAHNRLLPLAAYASLLWAGVNASPSSDLVRLSPNNYSASDPITIKRLNQSTLLSMDLDRPGVAPYIYDPTTVAYTVAYNVTAPGQGTYTNSGVTTPPTFPTINPRQAAPAQQGEFDPTTWRSLLANTLTRMNLNRSLTPYTGTGGNPAQAASDRQTFAMDIFTRLVNVTGMAATYNGGNLAGANPPATPQQYATLRWLAQLSANIVDFIDTDDVMTAFQWVQTAQIPAGITDSGYVFGTELPKLVVNEVYLEYDNDSTDPTTNPTPPPPQKATKPYHMNVWTELLNPLPSGTDINAPPNPNGIQVNNDAKLVDANNNPLYQLVITSPNQGLRNAANLTGDPDGAAPPGPPYAVQPYTLSGTPPGTYSSAATGGQVLAVVNNWGSVQSVTPVGTAQSSNAAANSNTGFLVVGPQNPPLAIGQNSNQQTQIVTSVTANNMAYTVPNADASADNPVPPTVLLQRLANPNAAFNATTNPYVTVDYVDMQQLQTQLQTATPGLKVVNDARPFNAAGANANFIASPNGRHSFGRNQPYGAEATAAEWQQQVAPANPPLTANQPTTTFFNVNAGATPAVAPDWLVHLDRPLISPMELLNVSGFKPHELTQQFYKDASGNFQHLAPWISYDVNGVPTNAQNFLLYRLLEFVKVKNATPGIASRGRVPGKININTLDAELDAGGNPIAPEVFRALCDAEPGNSFYNSSGGPTDAYVDQVFKTLMQARTPNGVPGPNDQPFWGMAQGPAAGGDALGGTPRGIAQTLLNGNLTNPNPAAVHPYQKMELLNKLFGNLTTRSNVFAVWLTVGFFQVVDDTVQPIKLGAEVNLAQGKNIRHHMFAIVDRTQIQTFSTTTTGVAQSPAPGAQVAIGLAANPVTDPRTGRNWQVGPGSILVYEPNTPNEETVIVGGTAANPTANFNLAHAAGTQVVSRGHPGPWNLPAPSLPYDPNQDAQVVPYIVIID